MQSSIGARLLQIVPTILLVSLIVFALQHLLPGDPAVMLAGDSAGDPHVVAQIRDQLLLNRPLWEQYLHWLAGVLHGNLGYSWELSAPVTTLILQKLPVTLQLSVMAFFFALAIGVPLGVVSAVKKGTPLDWLANSVGLFGLSVPTFWLGIVLILVVSVDLGWLPPSGYVPLSQDPLQSLRTTIMPSFVLGNAIAAIIMRHTRSAMLSALQQDYVRTARAKGLRESEVVLRHALRNALIPVVTLAGLQLGTLLSGAVLTEQVFDIPGIGKLVVDAVFNRDYPVIEGVVLVTGLLYVLINLVTDILYAVINPKLRGT
jgi:peptide/nickel transport system permease protein